MVKADVRKDYYADLGLQASADPDDIKKQFRKLGEQGESAQISDGRDPRLISEKI